MRVARDFEDLLASAGRVASRAGPGTDAGERAAAEWNALRQAQAAFEQGLRLGGGDPEKTRAVTAAFRAAQIQAAARIQDLEVLAPPVRYADGPAAGPFGGALHPAALVGAPSDGRALGREVLEAHQKLLEHAEADLAVAPVDREGFSYEDPVKRKAANRLRAALRDLEAVVASPESTDAQILAAGLRAHIAGQELSAPRSPGPGRVDPLLVGIGAFVEEFAKRGLSIASLGGTAGIERAIEEGRLDGRSGPFDVLWEFYKGLANGVTFGAPDAFVDAYAGQGRSGFEAFCSALGTFVGGPLGVDQLRVLADPKANAWQKGEAAAALLSTYAFLAAGGLSVRGTNKQQPPNRGERIPSPGDPDFIGPLPNPGTSDVLLAGTIDPKSLVAGSPEHKAARWSEYQARGGAWSYERWSKTYDGNMVRATQANAAVDDFWRQLGWGRREVVVDVEGVARKLDIGDVQARRGIEHKTGHQTATQETLWEIARDQILIEQGWSIRWHFKGTVSEPILKALRDAGIPYTVGN